ncbi:monovalent cation:proton antiporter [Dorcoceras hygrometricum]|uniref:Monovalent cation:proton antiporter n=1 Tax=Dorcoceras hygrometricum TaxID=472368 RepID=A0A2Z7AJB5_9LAMI|nr:monovalent cation:proton antiporter [Dorcoceras hygrometricum]
MRIRPPELETSICDVKYHVSLPPTSSPLGRTHASSSATNAPSPLRRTCSGHRAEEIPSVVNLLDLLVQTNKGIVIPVVDLIRRSTAAYNSRARILCESGWSQAPRRQQDNDSNILYYAALLCADSA